MEQDNPLIQVLAAMQATNIQVFNALFDAGVLTREQAINSLQTVRDAMPPELRDGIAGKLLDQLMNGLDRKSPEELRALFRVFDGTPQQSSRTTPPREPTAQPAADKTDDADD